MSVEQLQHRETLLIEHLLTSLDSRETARATGSTMLGYLADLLVEQSRKELEEVRASILALGNAHGSIRIAGA